MVSISLICPPSIKWDYLNEKVIFVDKLLSYTELVTRLGPGYILYLVRVNISISISNWEKKKRKYYSFPITHPTLHLQMGASSRSGAGKYQILSQILNKGNNELIISFLMHLFSILYLLQYVCNFGIYLRTDIIFTLHLLATFELTYI